MRVTFDNIDINLKYEGSGYLPPDSDWAMDYHTHNEFEMHFITEGKGINKLQSEELELYPDIIYLAPPQEVHKQWVDRTNPMGLYYLLFEISSGDTPFHLPRIYSHIPHLKMEMASIVQLQRAGSKGNLFRSQLKMIELIWKIIEPHIFNQKSETQPDKGYHYIEQAITYIQQRVTSPLGIDEIAEACHLSSRHLCRLFSQTTNMSIHSYIQNERFIWASSQLEHTIFSIGEISEMMNFSSAQYFCRWFRSIAAVSPGEYRIMQQNKMN
ncbi:MAG TPA: AraC family transcriptional regulator [Bacilli bacterium]